MHRENWITRLNYSQEAKGIFATLVFGSLALHIDSLIRGPSAPFNPPYFIKHTTTDVIGNAAQSAFNSAVFAGFLGAFSLPDHKKSAPLFGATTAFIMHTLGEIGQGVLQKAGLVEGGFAEIDIPAYALGSLLYLGYDLAAKGLYYSGVTKPVYKGLSFLGLQDRRVTSQDWSLF